MNISSIYLLVNIWFFRVDHDRVTRKNLLNIAKQLSKVVESYSFHLIDQQKDRRQCTFNHTYFQWRNINLPLITKAHILKICIYIIIYEVLKFITLINFQVKFENFLKIVSNLGGGGR